MKKSYYKSIPFLIFALIINAFATLLESYLLIRMAALFDLCIQGDMTALHRQLPVTFALIAMLLPIGVANGYIGICYSRFVNAKLKNRLVASALLSDYSSLRQIGKQKLISYATNDMQTIESDYTLAVFRIGAAICSLAGAIWMLVSASAWMLIVALVVVTMNVGISYTISKKSGKAYLERKNLTDDYTSYTKEFLNSFALLCANNLHGKMRSDFEEKMLQLDRNMFSIKKMLNRIGTTENFFVTVTSYVSICAVGVLSAGGIISLGGFLVALQGLLNLPAPLGSLVELFPNFIGGRAVMNKVDNDFSSKKVETAGCISLNCFINEIVFSDVSFSYNVSQCETLRIKSLVIEKGKKYLICGPSGGGKTTLLKLLQRIYEPNRGTITIDGISASEIDEVSYYSIISCVEQSVFLFEDTILNNITLNRDVSEDMVKKAVDISGLNEFIGSLPDGLNTKVFDNGKNISGGQRSRIALARAIAAGSPVLILDEAFANLDRESAMNIERKLLTMTDLTLISVSHIVIQENQIGYDCILRVDTDVTIETTVVE